MVEDSYLRFIEVLEKLFLVAGTIFLFLGFAGLILSVTFYNIGIFKDEVLSFGLGFINLFMTILGIILIIFHNKIMVKPREQY